MYLAAVVISFFVLIALVIFIWPDWDTRFKRLFRKPDPKPLSRYDIINKKK